MSTPNDDALRCAALVENGYMSAEAGPHIRRLVSENEAQAKQINSLNLLAKAQTEQLSHHRAQADKYIEAINTLQSERDANAILTAENAAQRELLRQAVEAMRDGLSVCNSVSTGKDRRVRRDGVTMYLQTEEWCDWLEKEVGPRIFDAATAINEHLDSNK